MAGLLNERRAAAVCAGVSGALMVLRALAEWSAGAPQPADILAWVDANRVPLMVLNELSFFAAISMIPVALAFSRRLGRHRPLLVGSAAVMVMLTAMAEIGALVIHGRLVYPMFGITLDSPESLALIVTMYYGMVHVADLLRAAAALMLGAAARAFPAWRSVAWAAVPIAAACVLTSFPDRLGPTLLLVGRLSEAAWLLLVGGVLLRAQAP